MFQNSQKAETAAKISKCPVGWALQVRDCKAPTDVEATEEMSEQGLGTAGGGSAVHKDPKSWTQSQQSVQNQIKLPLSPQRS